jgi:hypothetical protein
MNLENKYKQQTAQYSEPGCLGNTAEAGGLVPKLHKRLLDLVVCNPGGEVKKTQIDGIHDERIRVHLLKEPQMTQCAIHCHDYQNME